MPLKPPTDHFLDVNDAFKLLLEVICVSHSPLIAFKESLNADRRTVFLV